MTSREDDMVWLLLDRSSLFERLKIKADVGDFAASFRDAHRPRFALARVPAQQTPHDAFRVVPCGIIVGQRYGNWLRRLFAVDRKSVVWHEARLLASSAVRSQHRALGEFVIVGRDPQHGFLGGAIVHAFRKLAHFCRTLAPVPRIVDVAGRHSAIPHLNWRESKPLGIEGVRAISLRHAA
jgi:hypothetical protein